MAGVDNQPTNHQFVSSNRKSLTVPSRPSFASMTEPLITDAYHNIARSIAISVLPIDRVVGDNRGRALAPDTAIADDPDRAPQKCDCRRFTLAR
jgi:hypothetical protein